MLAYVNLYTYTSAIVCIYMCNMYMYTLSNLIQYMLICKLYYIQWVKGYNIYVYIYKRIQCIVSIS